MIPLGNNTDYQSRNSIILKIAAQATKDFQSVTGPGRNQRKTEFVYTWDNLVANNNDETTRRIIVKSCESCMQRNNDLIASVKKEPWWMKYMYGGMVISSVAVAVFAAGIYQFKLKSTGA